jgi:23S rRNA (guanosine2251-2'-O)-methyltransferase
MNKTYWLFGKHPVIAALANDRRRKFELIVTAKIHEEFKALGLKLNSLKVRICTHDEVAKIAKLTDQVHQGVALNVEPLPAIELNRIEPSFKQKIIALDQLTDPHNIGSIIRSAAAFGFDIVILPKNNSPQESAVMVKAAAGNFEKVQLCYVSNLASALTALSKAGYWVVGLDGNARDRVNKLSEYENLVLVMGSEGEGLRDLTQKKCDLMVKISMQDGVESLNVSNACAIAMYEATRKLS